MGFVYKVLFLPFAFLIKAEVGSLLFVLSGKNLIITFQHIVIQVVRKNTRLCTSLWLCTQTVARFSANHG